MKTYIFVKVHYLQPISYWNFISKMQLNRQSWITCCLAVASLRWVNCISFYLFIYLFILCFWFFFLTQILAFFCCFHFILLSNSKTFSLLSNRYINSLFFNFFISTVYANDGIFSSLLHLEIFLSCFCDFCFVFFLFSSVLF